MLYVICSAQLHVLHSTLLHCLCSMDEAELYGCAYLKDNMYVWKSVDAHIIPGI